MPLARYSSHFTRLLARAAQGIGENRAKSLSCGCREFAGRSMDYTDCGTMCHLQGELLTSGDQALEDQRGIILPLDCLQTLHVLGTIRRQHLLIVVGVVHHSATVSLCKRRKCGACLLTCTETGYPKPLLAPAGSARTSPMRGRRPRCRLHC